METSRRSFLAGSLALTAAFPKVTKAQDSAMDDRRVVLVTLDGLRWQEVFGGADAVLMEKTGGDVESASQLRREFWRESPEERRSALLPFFWDTIAKQGRLIGDPKRGDDVQLTNGLKFSYPGYNEMLTGAADPRVDSNEKRPNPNINVLEWLNGREPFASHVAAFCAWDVFAFILNRERSGMPVQAGWEPIAGAPTDPQRATINALYESLHREWENSAYDGLVMESALACVKADHPKVLYISLGETDEHAHHNRYDYYLRAAHRADAQLRRLWELIQSDPEYRGRTSLLLTTDHGRGEGDAWTSHGKSIEGAERIWIGLLGPEIEPALVPTNATQSQIAATVAALVGEDFRSLTPTAAASLVPVKERAVTR